MNVYDFDGTIYDGDSSVDFVIWCMLRYPKGLLRLPPMGVAAVRYLAHGITKTQAKQVFFSFLRNVPDAEGEVVAFWNEHERKVGQWYRDRHRDDDVVISASPEFLLREVCSRLGIQNLIASDVDPSDGTFLHDNCHGKEKPNLFYRRFPGAEVEAFYSDSVRADWPMAEEAQSAFLVTHGRLSPWPEGQRGPTRD